MWDIWGTNGTFVDAKSEKPFRFRDMRIDEMPREFPRAPFSNRQSSPLSRIAKVREFTRHAETVADAVLVQIFRKEIARAALCGMACANLLQKRNDSLWHWPSCQCGSLPYGETAVRPFNLDYLPRIAGMLDRLDIIRMGGTPQGNRMFIR